MPDSYESTNSLLKDLVAQQNGGGDASNTGNPDFDATLGSESEVVASYSGGLARLDARQSKTNGMQTGGTQGRHLWTLSSQVNTVDIAGARTPITIVPGANVLVNALNVSKINTGNSWNSSFYSDLAFDPNQEDFAVSWLIESVTGTIREMGGLDDNPAQNNSYNSLEYAVYQVNNYFNSSVYEKGAAVRIPNYTTFYFQVGDRAGIKCVNNVVSYFVLRGGVETVLYTSTKRATTPLYFKGAFNRGSTSSGHSNIGSVEWHTAKKVTSNTVQIAGGATDTLTEEDREKLQSVGMDAAAGTIYSDIQFTPSLTSKFVSGSPFPLSYGHGYIGVLGQQIGTLNY